MTNETTTIGVLCETYDRTFLCTVAELRDAMKDAQCHYTVRQYCDFRCSTNLQRFLYDPLTGERIDWRKVKELLTKE